MLGAGFWSRYQLAGWDELVGVRCVALCDPDLARAEARGAEFNIGAVYTDAARLLREVEVDFVDIVAPVEAHAPLVRLAADHGKDVICQKPLATTLAEAEDVVRHCREAGVRLFVHENWRWQAPFREVKRVLESGVIGPVFRAGIDMISGFPVFQNQPFLKDLEQFIITDLGSHTLDAARYLFGEAADVTAWTGRANPEIRGEDHATIVMRMGGRGIPVLVRMAYAENFVERECFPQTLLFIEGKEGSLELAPGYELKVTTRDGVHTRRVPVPFYAWADPRYEVVHSSIVPCNRDLLAALQGCPGAGETSGEDNLRTVRLVFAAYESAAARRTVRAG
jgi:predicted dehydrogenase